MINEYKEGGCNGGCAAFVDKKEGGKEGARRRERKGGSHTGLLDHLPLRLCLLSNPCWLQLQLMGSDGLNAAARAIDAAAAAEAVDQVKGQGGW